MKTFFQSLLGSLTAVIILMVIAFAGMLALIGVIATINQELDVEIEPGSVLVFDLNTIIQDTPPVAEIGSAVQEAISAAVFLRMMSK